jgi:transcription antitermination factor NusG
MAIQGIEMVSVIATEGSPWWALYTRHQHEKAVADALLAKGFEVFLPVYESVRLWKDRKKVISFPLFPCYVFVRGGLNRRLHVVTTPGVHSILSRGEQVATIPEGEITAIQRSIGARLRVEPHPYLNCGDQVRVVRGPLEGVAGILIRKKSLCRLILSVDTLARSIAVEIDATDVEPTGREVPKVTGSRQPEVIGYLKHSRPIGAGDESSGILIPA